MVSEKLMKALGYNNKRQMYRSLILDFVVISLFIFLAVEVRDCNVAGIEYIDLNPNARAIEDAAIQALINASNISLEDFNFTPIIQESRTL